MSPQSSSSSLLLSLQSSNHRSWSRAFVVRRVVILCLLGAAVRDVRQVLPMGHTLSLLVRTNDDNDNEHAHVDDQDHRDALLETLPTHDLDDDRLDRPTLWETVADAHQCLLVEDLCHGSQRLFYRTPDHDAPQRPKQPRLLLQVQASEGDAMGVGGDLCVCDRAVRDALLSRPPSLIHPSPCRSQADDEVEWHKGFQRTYDVGRQSVAETVQRQCTDAKTHNHVILYSRYNDMLGEFYSRSIRGLYQLVQSLNVTAHHFATHTDLYIHRMNPSKPIMNSHMLFTDAFRGTPALGDLGDLLDTTACRCLPRVLFCGYQIERLPSKDKTYSPRSPNTSSSILRLIPSEGLHDPTSESRRQRGEYAHLRQFLRQQLLHSQVMRDVEAYRASLLGRHTTNVRIIGLAQRNGRRKWRNMPQLLRRLKKPLRTRGIVLVEVNVEEEDWTPYQHLIRHAALDGLVGIHGAQLTDAIWMKEGSLIVELLPYIPKKIIYGHWTTNTKDPTPLGVIFDSSDLLHVGYRLQRDSAPYCYDEPIDCWTVDYHPWDERDFEVSAELLSQLLEQFVIHRPKTCEEYEDLSTPDSRIVVYNAPCAPADSSAPIVPRHFYWSE